jgi:hypothetical protein
MEQNVKKQEKNEGDRESAAATTSDSSKNNGNENGDAMQQAQGEQAQVVQDPLKSEDSCSIGEEEEARNDEDNCNCESDEDEDQQIEEDTMDDAVEPKDKERVKNEDNSQQREALSPSP